MTYVSHDAAEVQRIATRVVRIEGGRVVATGGAELLNSCYVMAGLVPAISLRDAVLH